jgi:hypothetical protein
MIRWLKTEIASFTEYMNEYSEKAKNSVYGTTDYIVAKEVMSKCEGRVDAYEMVLHLLTH